MLASPLSDPLGLFAPEDAATEPSNGRGGERHTGPVTDEAALMRAAPLTTDWKGCERAESVHHDSEEYPVRKVDCAVVTMMMNGSENKMDGKKCRDSEGTHLTVPPEVQLEIKHTVDVAMMLGRTSNVVVGGSAKVWGYAGHKDLQSSLEFECRKRTSHSKQSINPHGEFWQQLAKIHRYRKHIEGRADASPPHERRP